MFQIWWKRDAFDGLQRWLIFVYFVFSCMTSIHGSGIDRRVMRVGEELFREMLPLQNGARFYQLQGLRPHTWYEVKISYPASIPSAFTLQLSRGITDLTSNRGRKLLNTEKLIFKTDGTLSMSDQSETSVLVNVEPEGFVAIPGKREQKYVIFNIVCDELLLGIPHQAWYVAVLVLFCLMFAFAVPSFLPPHFMPKMEHRQLLPNFLSYTTLSLKILHRIVTGTGSFSFDIVKCKVNCESYFKMPPGYLVFSLRSSVNK